MWTFLGVATFTYLYKKSSVVLALTHTELVLVVVLVFGAGLLLSYFSFYHRPSVSHLVSLPFHFLSLLPLFNHLLPQTAARTSRNTENFKRVRNQTLLFISFIL